MEQSIAELKHLQMNGFEVDGRLYKVRVLVITTDTMARPVLKNTSQFNGAFGCDWCLLEGKMVKKGKGHTRVYPEPKKKQFHKRGPLRSIYAIPKQPFHPKNLYTELLDQLRFLNYQILILFEHQFQTTCTPVAKE